MVTVSKTSGSEASVGSAIGIQPVAGNIGAEITGINAGSSVSDEAIAFVHQALLENKVVFLRDQVLDYATLVAFAQRFGSLTYNHPIYAPPESEPYLREIDSSLGVKANHWHTDLTFVDKPPALAFLYAKIIPPVGGDTMWANTVAAYEAMPSELRTLAEQLRIVHSNDSDYTDATVAQRDEYVETLYEANHPAVHVHPVTGQRAIVAGGFARRVQGMTPHASRDLLRVIQDFATTPEHTVRWRWRVGDLAIWDNRATQHYAIFDYGHDRRRCERVTVAGEQLVGVDGRHSEMVRGTPS